MENQQDNAVTLCMKKLLAEKYRDCLVGNFSFIDNQCKLEERGGVYGIAVKLSQNQVEEFFNKYNDKKNKIALTDWKPIDKNYYPLYWGKDANLGFRLFDHTKMRGTTETLQLEKRKYLNNYDTIYGAVFCKDIKKCEDKLHNTYPDIFKNYSGEHDFPD